MRRVGQWATSFCLRRKDCRSRHFVESVPEKQNLDGCAFLPLRHRRWKRTHRVIEHTFATVNTGTSRDYVQSSPRSAASKAFAREFVVAVDSGMRHFGISLLDQDLTELQSELARCHAIVAVLRRKMQATPPGLVIVANDSDSPNIEAVAVAQAEGIPSLLLQHGLDCDRYVYDQSPVEHLAVWGPERRGRYTANLSAAEPHIEIVGNPEYDHEFPRVDQPVAGGSTWLWVTRPHTTKKCVLPSRNSLEGLEIFDAVLEALAKCPHVQLVIKPHRYDYVQSYKSRLKSSSVSARVSIDGRPLEQLFREATLVITEDTTAALEAMFHGKPLIHAHFADTPPLLPLVDCGAAWPGYDQESLVDSLLKMMSLTRASHQSMIDGQQSFMEAFHPLHGGAAQRLDRFLAQVISAA